MRLGAEIRSENVALPEWYFPLPSEGNSKENNKNYSQDWCNRAFGLLPKYM